MTIPQILDKARLGLMIPVDEAISSLPLEHTSVVAQVIGPLCTVAVTQRFANPFAAPVELEYLFPLPHGAAIVDFELRIGNRTIKSDLQEIEQARTAYESARSEGKRAGLFEERRPNLFAIQIANVLPGDTLLATMRYQEHLSYDDGSYSFVFPMGLTPKYHSPAAPDENRGVDAPIAEPGEKIGDVEISVAVDAGLPYGDPTSPSHKIDLTCLDELRFSICLAEAALPDHDFVLRYPVARDQATVSVWRSKGEDTDYFLASVLPPPVEGTPIEPPRRDFTFVLDRSGSMSGGPIAQARNALRACLRTLDPRDRFSLLLFDDRMEWLNPEPLPVSQQSIDQADAFLAQVEGRGGTEIVTALQEALSRPSDNIYQRTIVFLTDGAVSAEARALDQVRRSIGKARLFTFGIGPSVNRALLSQMAQSGGGTAEFLQLNEDIEGAILRFQDRVSFPVLTGLTLHWKNGRAWDVYPARLPDLFTGQPLEMIGRLKTGKSGPVRLEVRGERGQEIVTFQLTLGDESRVEPVIARAWARARVDDLLESSAAGLQPAYQVRQEVIGLALEHRLVTPYTAFVAIDDRPAKQAAENGKPLGTIHVAQPLPAGLEMEGFLGGPKTQMRSAPSSVFPGAVPSAPSHVMYDIGPISDKLDLPMFLRKKSGKIPSPLKQTGPAVHENSEPNPQNLIPGDEDTLRWLVRAQELNGSWQGDIELTAAALLAFLRHGFTPRIGYYRRQVQKAVDWLLQVQGSGTAAFSRAAVIHELAWVTTDAGLKEKAHKEAGNLPKPSTPLQKLIAAQLLSPSESVELPKAIHSLEDLQLAALLNVNLAVPAKLIEGDLGKVYAACINVGLVKP